LLASMAAVNGQAIPVSGTAGSYDTTYPSPDAAPPRTYSVGGFRIATQKLPILKAAPIEAMTEALGIAPPEMIFGDNFIAIEHLQSGWGIKFDAFGALDRVDKTGEKRLKVSYSKEWHESRENDHDIKEVVKPFDWSYTTDYKGDLKEDAPQFEPTEKPIPLELLRRPDPILFFDDVMLYEDELADNGITVMSVKIRVMPARLLLLSRLFMRLDNVLVRLRDTRVYVEFATGEVIREYSEKEEAYDSVREKLASRRDDVAAVLRDPNQVGEELSVVTKTIERVSLKR
jgi:type 2A phosphatase activator TIP41